MPQTDHTPMLNALHKPFPSFIAPSNLVKILALFAALSQSGIFLAAGDAIDPASGNAVPSVPEIASQGYKLAFSDEFRGPKLDEDKWQYRIDSKGQSTQLPANVTVSNGLHIAVKKEDSRGKKYTAGGVITKAELKYGYYEARFRAPPGSGFHTSFYAEQWNGKDTGVTLGREEIDICEEDSKTGATKIGYLFTVHDWGSMYPAGSRALGPKSGSLPWAEQDRAKPYSNGPALCKDFHVWGMEFTPTVVRFYFDGEWKGSIDATGFAHTPMNVFLTTIGWAGTIDDSQLPSEAQFDYFRFFTKP